MNAVKQNPYRTLGLFGNSSEKELQKQVATIKRFAEVGKTNTFDYDFPFFGEIDRNSEKIQDAANKIEQAKNKVHYALFWFLNNGHVDETALNNLKNGHIEKAVEIWEKTITNTVVTSQNFSAVINLSTLQLGIVTYNGSFDPKKFTASIDLKGKLILSEVFNDFVKSIIGDGILLNRDIILIEFADEILQIVKPYLNSPNGLELSQLIDSFNSFPNETKQYISRKFTDGPLSNIENKIEKIKNCRIENPSDSEIFGEELYNETVSDLSILKNIWSINNVQYQIIVNRVANEVLQCSIDFFNTLTQEDPDFDPFEDAFRLTQLAKSLNPTGQILDRVNDSISSLEEISLNVCRKAIGIMLSIKDAFIKLDKENNSLSYLEKKYINESIVNELLRKEVTFEIIRRLAKSKNQIIIAEFYNLLKYLFNRIKNKVTLNSIENNLFHTLSDNSTIKNLIIEERKRREKLEYERNESFKIIEQQMKLDRKIQKKAEREEKIKYFLILISIVVLILFIIYSIWGTEGLYIAGMIALVFFIPYFIGIVLGLIGSIDLFKKK